MSLSRTKIVFIVNNIVKLIFCTHFQKSASSIIFSLSSKDYASVPFSSADHQDVFQVCVLEINMSSVC